MIEPTLPYGLVVLWYLVNLAIPKIILQLAFLLPF